MNILANKIFVNKRKKTNLALCKIMGCLKLTYNPEKPTLKVAHSIFNNVKKSSAARFPKEFQKVVHIYGIHSKYGSFGALLIF